MPDELKSYLLVAKKRYRLLALLNAVILNKYNILINMTQKTSSRRRPPLLSAIVTMHTKRFSTQRLPTRSHCSPHRS